MDGVGCNTDRRDMGFGGIKQFEPDKLHKSCDCGDVDVHFVGGESNFIWVLTIFLKGF